MPPTVTCPLCNAEISVPADAAARRMVECPVCEGVFPFITGPTGRDVGPSLFQESASRPRGRLSPRVALAIVLGLGLLGVAVGFLTSHPAPPPAPAQKRPQVVAWDKVLAAEWLPPGCELAAALQPAAWVEAAGGVEALGLPPEWPALLTNLTGLTPEQVDSVAVGVRPGRLIPPEVVFIVVGRLPFTPSPAGGGVRDAASPAGRALKSFPIADSKFTAYAQQVKDNVVAMALAPDDHDRLPAAPHLVAEVLGPALLEAVGSRFTGEVPAWLAFRAEVWADAQKLLAQMKLGPGQGRLLERLADVRGGALAARLDRPTHLNLWLDLRDEATAVAWRDRWEKAQGEAPPGTTSGRAGRSVFASAELSPAALEYLSGPRR